MTKIQAATGPLPASRALFDDRLIHQIAQQRAVCGRRTGSANQYRHQILSGSTRVGSRSPQ